MPELHWGEIKTVIISPVDKKLGHPVERKIGRMLICPDGPLYGTAIFYRALDHFAQCLGTPDYSQKKRTHLSYDQYAVDVMHQQWGIERLLTFARVDFRLVMCDANLKGKVPVVSYGERLQYRVPPDLWNEFDLDSRFRGLVEKWGKHVFMNPPAPAPPAKQLNLF